MLAHFPEPYRDELLYSVVARCAKRLGQKTYREMSRSLFDSRQGRAKIDFPDRLGYMSTKIPGRLHGRPQEIAWSLTLLPLFAPFLRPEIFQQIETELIVRSSGHGAIVGLSPLKVGYPKRLRYCSECWRQDKKNLGERYWRRSHQAPGVWVCPVHGIAVCNSDITTMLRASVQRYLDADEIQTRPHHREKFPRRARGMLQDIAKDVEWMLCENKTRPGPNTLRAGYFKLLSDLGLTSGPQIRQQGLHAKIKDVLGRDVFEWFMRTLEIYDHRAWFGRLVLNSRSSRVSQAPICHLLLMRALAGSARSFIPIVEEIALKVPPFVRNGTKISESPEMASKVRDMWDDPHISIAEMARRLKVYHSTISTIAAKANLRLPRRVLTCWPMPITYTKQSTVRQRSNFKKLKHEKPNAGMKELDQCDPSLISWLRQHDRRWLEKNRPLAIRRGGAPGLNWSERDKEYHMRVTALFAEHVPSTGQKLSRSWVERSLGLRLSNFTRRIPQTIAAVDEFLSMRQGPRLAD